MSRFETSVVIWNVLLASIIGAVQLASRLGYHGREDEMLHHLELSKVGWDLAVVAQGTPAPTRRTRSRRQEC